MIKLRHPKRTKIYAAQSGATEARVRTDDELGAEFYTLKPRFDLCNHSPDGFAWGYLGSGPAQLALALLADLTDDETAQTHYQDFKYQVIARQPKDEAFVMRQSEILIWLRGATRLVSS